MLAVMQSGIQWWEALRLGPGGNLRSVSGCPVESRISAGGDGQPMLGGRKDRCAALEKGAHAQEATGTLAGRAHKQRRAALAAGVRGGCRCGCGGNV